MRRPLTFLSFAAALAACGAEQDHAAPALAAPPVDGAWIVDKAASRIGFTGTQTDKAFTGAFERFDATILFDPADLASSRIEAAVDTGSARTGDRQRDAALPGAEWFDASAYPTAQFSSRAIRATGPHAYEADGTLAIRGVEKPLTLPFTVTIANGRAVADASVSVNRSEFGVGQGEEFATDRWVGYDVTVTIHLEATR
ncbi:MAG: YceI family protein [Parvularculaceae bacterium]